MKYATYLISIFFIIIISNNESFCQTISSTGTTNLSDNNTVVLYTDTLNHRLYVGGGLYLEADVPCWTGNDWIFYKDSTLIGQIFAYTSFKGKMYGGGVIGSSLAPQPYRMFSLINQKDSVWEFSNVDGDMQGNVVWGMMSDSNYLYVFGGFDSVGGVAASNIARFDGTTWDAPYPRMKDATYQNAITDAIFYKGELYVGGNFGDTPLAAAAHLGDIAKWNGTEWVAVGNGLSSLDTWVSDFQIYKGDLIVVGRFFTAYGDPGNCIARWDGNQWLPMGNGVGPTQAWEALEYHGDLYVSGSLDYAGNVTVKNLAKWNGTEWLYPGMSFDNGTCPLALMDDDLYIGGGFWHVNNIPCTHVIRYNDVTGITFPMDASASMKCYPNPTSTQLYIQIAPEIVPSIQNLLITDMCGREIYSQIPVSQYDVEINLNVAALPTGIYYVKLITEKGTILQKFMKE